MRPDGALAFAPPSSMVRAWIRSRSSSRARRYADFVEQAASLTVDERLAIARLRLLELYAAALSLPDAEPTDASADRLTPPSWRGFDDHDMYWLVLDPYRREAPVAGSLSDDLIEIYREIRDGLALWDTSHAADAIWAWRFGFESHWGTHAIDALRALHHACRA